MPLGKDDRIEAIKSAFFAYPLYHKLYDRFKGKVILEKDLLANLLYREFKVSPRGKDVLARNFISSLRFAQLAGESDGRLIIPSEEPEEGNIKMRCAKKHQPEYLMNI